MFNVQFGWSAHTTRCLYIFRWHGQLMCARCDTMRRRTAHDSWSWPLMCAVACAPHYFVCRICIFCIYCRNGQMNGERVKCEKTNSTMFYYFVDWVLSAGRWFFFLFFRSFCFRFFSSISSDSILDLRLGRQNERST